MTTAQPASPSDQDTVFVVRDQSGFPLGTHGTLDDARKEAFTQARALPNALVFVDEIDSNGAVLRRMKVVPNRGADDQPRPGPLGGGGYGLPPAEARRLANRIALVLVAGVVLLIARAILRLAAPALAF